MIPKELESFEHVGHYQFKKRYFIYCLYNKGKLRYVGRTTTHPLTRVAGHKDKKFTDIYYYIMNSKSECKAEENRMILKFRPLYNKNGYYHQNRTYKKKDGAKNQKASIFLAKAIKEELEKR